MRSIRLLKHWLQATPGLALLLVLARRPGLPEHDPSLTR